MNKLLGMGDEYIVKAPWERVRWCLKDGTVKERRQDIRERVTRCRDCENSTSMGYQCEWFHDDYLTHAQVVPDGFCAWGVPRDWSEQ